MLGKATCSRSLASANEVIEAMVVTVDGKVILLQTLFDKLRPEAFVNPFGKEMLRKLRFEPKAPPVDTCSAPVGIVRCTNLYISLNDAFRQPKLEIALGGIVNVFAATPLKAVEMPVQLLPSSIF